jgi:hypothetical protein
MMLSFEKSFFCRFLYELPKLASAVRIGGNNLNDWNSKILLGPPEEIKRRERDDGANIHPNPRGAEVGRSCKQKQMVLHENRRILTMDGRKFKVPEAKRTRQRTNGRRKNRFS